MLLSIMCKPAGKTICEDDVTLRSNSHAALLDIPGRTRDHRRLVTARTVVTISARIRQVRDLLADSGKAKVSAVFLVSEGVRSLLEAHAVLAQVVPHSPTGSHRPARPTKKSGSSGNGAQEAMLYNKSFFGVPATVGTPPSQKASER